MYSPQRSLSNRSHFTPPTGMIQPRQDVQTVTPEGEPVAPLIHGVVISPAVTHVDGRGTLCEILNERVHSAPIVYVYQFTIRPGMAKGWHVHRLHDDRIFLSQGTLKVVLYDDRRESPTYGMVNEIHRSEFQRNVMVIPAHVYHAHQNIGATDAFCISMPTRRYDHANPDVYRLPLDTDYIPYKLVKRDGW
jgi:dTDP-4-dehydrorhamnose 3,5-epimerase